ncbi:uncharacterized protein LOC132737203 isoform X2 [Ruditapes philippinarum]|uniref:uncharacterized protein LOC132737203 isoform X2 n=1 Tax=Ruditapes philippinarum TaxID=129788 RepID=UPI00295A658A|nr:uncharacterized protein LOC132737203 isoform X2 [Ruditapes philippinarum]
MQNLKVENIKSTKSSRMNWPLLHIVEEPQSVIPIDGPTKPLGGNLIPGDIAVFDDKAANAVLLDAESQLKSGYPTIATSSMVARRNRITIEEVDNASDIRFFSDLVKPMQYRWKFQKEKLKTIAPSKYGFHQRSQSPTFQRLIEANEKLQNIAGQDSELEDNASVRDFFDTQSEILPYKQASVLRHVKSDQVSTRTSYTGSVPATNDVPLQKNYELKPEVRNIEPAKKTKDYVIQNALSVSVVEKKSPSPTYDSPPTPPLPKKPAKSKKQQQEFKVDFKKLDSHSELHLFLPHIQDGNSRGATPEELNRKGKEGVTFPAIEDLKLKTFEEDKAKNKKKNKYDNKKKKKQYLRVKSGIEDKEVKDILNDIPTLISLETDKDFHTESMCMFENCKLHKHRKSTRIRQA